MDFLLLPLPSEMKRGELDVEWKKELPVQVKFLYSKTVFKRLLTVACTCTCIFYFKFTH